MSDSLSWSLGAIALIAFSLVVTRFAGTPVSMAAAGATLAVTGGLWWLWRHEQSVQASPMSEYVAVGYGWAFYGSLVLTWESVGDRWVDWLIILPPISFAPLMARRLFQASSGDSSRSDRLAFVAHRLAAAAFLAVGAFLLLSVLAAVVAPVPLIAAALHLVAGRFYARHRDT